MPTSDDWKRRDALASQPLTQDNTPPDVFDRIMKAIQLGQVQWDSLAEKHLDIDRHILRGRDNTQDE